MLKYVYIYYIECILAGECVKYLGIANNIENHAVRGLTFLAVLRFLYCNNIPLPPSLSVSLLVVQVIRLALERLQIFEDKTLYELHEGCPGDEDNWTLLKEGETNITTRARAPHTVSLRHQLKCKPSVNCACAVPLMWAGFTRGLPLVAR